MVNWITDTIGYKGSAVNIGLIKYRGNNYVVDTGIDNNAINKVRKSVEKKIDGALVTHHHADHMGGCYKLQSLNIKDIYVPEGEIPFFKNPLLEPFTMFGGSYPPELLRNRHLEAQSVSMVKRSTDQSVAEIVKCPGHTPDHQAYLHEEFLFSGDAAFTSETIGKYKLLFAVDPKKAAASLSILLKLDFDVMIPGHGPLQQSKKDADAVIKATMDHYNSTRDNILSIIGEKMEYDNYVRQVMNELDLLEIIKDRGFLQYTLYQVPIKGYLSNLLNDQVVSIEMDKTGPMIQAL